MQFISENRNFITLITAITALLALFQPWIVILWKKYFWKGKIEVYRTGNVEITYGVFGPEIGLTGTLRALDRDIFVKDIHLELIKDKDSSKHSFNWGLSRSHKITLGDKKPSETELPYGFLVSPSLEKRYNILYQDLETESDMREVIKNVADEWYDSEEGRASLTNTSNAEPVEPGTNEAAIRYSLYNEFRKGNRIFLESNDKLRRMFYWEAGSYSLKMEVKTSNPDQSFMEKWTFSISETQEKRLLLNVLNILDSACGFFPPPHAPQLFYEYSKYESCAEDKLSENQT